jgi:hypothetical protein
MARHDLGKAAGKLIFSGSGGELARDAVGATGEMFCTCCRLELPANLPLQGEIPVQVTVFIDDSRPGGMENKICIEVALPSLKSTKGEKGRPTR